MIEMALRTLALSLLIAIGTAGAQSPLPELRIEPTDGGSFLYIRNSAAQPLTGFLIELLNYPGSYFAYWQDDITSEPIAPAGEQKIRTGNMTVGAVPDYVKMQAALYADGSSSGAPEKVALLEERSKFVLETTQTLIQRLEKARAESKAKGAVIAGLKQWSDSLQPAGKPKRYSQPDIDNAAARSLIEVAIAFLNEHSLNETLSELHAKEHRALGNKG